MKDRVVQFPHRYQLVPVEGETNVYDFVPVPGTITEEGTPLNKATLLSDATAALYGLTGEDATVDKALSRASLASLASYMAFCANINADTLDAAFGKSNEDSVMAIGRQLVMYSKWKGESIEFTNLQNQNTFTDCITNSWTDISKSYSIIELISASPYALLSAEDKIVEIILGHLDVDLGENPTWADVAASPTAMEEIVMSGLALNIIAKNDSAKTSIIANITEFNNLADTMKTTLDSSPLFTSSSGNGNSLADGVNVVLGSQTSFVYVNTMNDANGQVRFLNLKHQHNGTEMVHPAFPDNAGQGVVTVKKFGIGGANIVSSGARDNLSWTATKYEAV